MRARRRWNTYEVAFDERDAANFQANTDAPERTVVGCGVFVFDLHTGDIVDARGAANGRGEIEWLAFSQDAQDFAIAVLGVCGYECELPELTEKNPVDRISRTRGVKSMKGPYSKEKGYEPWIKRSGVLGKGFLTTMTKAQRHSSLDACVREYGYRSCLGRIMVLERAKSGPRGQGVGVGRKYATELKESRDYLRKTYGGKGSFGPKKKVSKRRAA